MSNNDETEVIEGTSFAYSPVDMDDLDATEYTLVTIAADRSGSTYNFTKEMEKCVGDVVMGCARSPRSANLLVRYITFESQIEQVHGFKNLSTVKASDYDGTLDPAGRTVLHDAAVNAVQATAQQGKTLLDEDFDANGIVIVITDGQNNGSLLNTAAVQKAIQNARQEECLESINTILVGVGASKDLDTYLKKLQADWGFSDYINIGDSSPSNVARLCDFMSRSISSTSDALGTGGPSASLQF